MQLVTVDESSVDIQNCVFPSIQGDELFHFLGMPIGGHALIASNYFGSTSGYNDIIDFTGGNRPGPIVEMIGNVFEAAVDDCFDMDGCDAHIEGNVFLNVRQDAVRDSSSNAISTGADGGQTSELVIVRNFFYNCEHALLLKDGGSALMQNNTIVGIGFNPLGSQPPGVINFSEANRGTPAGRGALFEGNIVWDLQASPWVNFTNESMFLDVSHSIIQGVEWPGEGNRSADPLLVNVEDITGENVREHLALLPGSPALGTGPNGLDMGAAVAAGATISGTPTGMTTNTTVTLRVAGPGIYAYRWRLDDGPWSAEVALTNSVLIGPDLFADAPPIVIEDLPVGNHQVEVIGKNSAGSWQNADAPARSGSWAVLPSPPGDGQAVGGRLLKDTVWSRQSGTIWVLASVEVPTGVALWIEPGCDVRFSAGLSLAITGGALFAEGERQRPIRFRSMDPTDQWGPLRGSGAGTEMVLRHVEIDRGHVEVAEGAVALLEDSYLHDFVSGSTPIIHTIRPGAFTLRRCHVARYQEILSQLAMNWIEDCLFEEIEGDGVDFDGARPGSTVRSCTFRHGLDVNVDALDIGNFADGTVSEGVTVESSVMHDFPSDKGISIGEQASDITVRDCVIYGVDIGVAVKDSASAAISQTTISGANHGFRLFEKTSGRGGGRAVTWNNVLWGNSSDVTRPRRSRIPSRPFG